MGYLQRLGSTWVKWGSRESTFFFKWETWESAFLNWESVEIVQVNRELHAILAAYVYP